MISDSMNVDTNILLITDNVAELYHEKGPGSLFTGENAFWSISNSILLNFDLSQNFQNSPLLVFLRSVAIIIHASSMPKAKLKMAMVLLYMSPYNIYTLLL